MLTKSKRHFLIRKICYSLAVATSIAIFTQSCKKGVAETDPVENPVEETANLTIQDAIIPEVWDVKAGEKTLLEGRGYQVGDVIHLQPESGQGAAFTYTLTEVTASSAVFVPPSQLGTGRYRVSASRGELSQNLGTCSFNLVLRTEIVNRAGMTVKGVVHIGGVGIADVVVSDGYEVVKTDAEGVYYLASNKRTGYVFVSIPGNHEMQMLQGNLPQFYRYLNANPNIVDTRDFELKAVNNDNHVVLSLADMHLANRNEDLKQFQEGFMTDANQQIAQYQALGKKVYALTLGDLTWETYWYSNNFMLPEYVKEMAKLNAPVYNTIGNHDNDPYFASDWLSENTYRRILGPTYYSFNIGQVHYIVLDNIEYLNTGGAVGTIGSRNYNAKLAEQQLRWLEKDLATVDASTPIVLATHIQLHNAPASNGTLPGYRMSNGQQLVDLLARFAEVHVWTGHTHVNYHVARSDHFMEHNTAAICATWWWTGRSGYANNHIAPDGSPGGYGIWQMDGKKLSWQYKAIGFAKDYQFRAYDLNNVHITAANYAPNANSEHQRLVEQYAFDFAKANKRNEVLINVWGYDPKWSVAVSENGLPLAVQRVSSYDPLHIISYGMKRLNVNAVPTFDASNSSHMFKVQASSPSSTLLIQVTDRFGKQYSERMERPKAFTYAMH